MDALVNRISPILHLTRVSTAFAAVGNAWFIVLWTRASSKEAAVAPAPVVDEPLALVLLGATLYALGLFAFANALGDTLDARRDRALYPDRPIPSGRLSIETATTLVAISLLIAILGASLLGQPAVFMCLLTAFAIWFYHAAGKFIPSVGLVSLGLIYGAHMMIANPNLIFVWPVLLVMAHALLLGAITHRLGQKRPVLTRSVLITAAAGWAFWTGVLLYVGLIRAGTWWPQWVAPQAAIVPIALAAIFVIFAWNKSRMTKDPRRGAEKLRRYGALWVTLYATGWLIGQGYFYAGLYLAGLSLVGLLGMTVLREVYGLIEQPVGYRR